MDLLQRFIVFIEKERLFSKQDVLLVAVSGGLDSVVLCSLLNQAGFHFAIAHCNFGLRGEESNRDEAFVQALTTQLDVPFYLKRFDTKTFAQDHKLSIQVAARELRYRWFHKILSGEWSLHNEERANSSLLTIPKLPLTYIVTAHHLDDNIETLLINLFKGTGIGGLHGIQAKSGKVIRPLLFATREDIHDYAQVQQLSWVEDSSNAEIKYTRNYVRHQIIPAITQGFPMAKQNMAESLHRFQDAETLYLQAVQLHKNRLLEYKGDEVHIPVLKLERSIPLATILYEIIKDFGFSSQQVPEVIKLLRSDSGKYILSSTHRILRNRAWLVISSIPKLEETILVIETDTSMQAFSNGVLYFKALPINQVSIETSPAIALLDLKEVKFPLLLRKWKDGDYFYPLGMPKKKKLARFFIDQKLSQTQKENVWVLESQKRIIWIVGYRIDDRFKITDGTKEVLRIELK